MAEYKCVRIDDIEAIAGGAFRRARSALGITSFGMQVVEMPPNATGYPEHDHAEDGTEEVYIALRGSGEIEIEGERVPLDADHMISVMPGTKRKVFPGADGLRMLAIGGVPGKAYEVKQFTEVGQPDPFAQASA